MLKMITKSELLFICLLVLNVFVVDISSDIFSPAIPDIQKDLGTTVFLSESLVGLSVFWLGISALFYGILSDWYGRKFASMVGLVTFFVGALGSSFSTDITTFLISRNIQGIGSGFALAIGIAALRDRYQEEMFIKLTSIIGAVLLFVPVVAPVIGSYLTINYGWRSTFYFVLVLAVFALIMTAWKFRETNTATTKPNFQSIWKNSIAVLTTKNYLFYVIINSCVTACIWLLINFTPYIVQTQYNRSIREYGIALSIALLSGVLGALINTKLIQYMSEKKILIIMLSLSLLAGVIIYFSAYMSAPHIVSLVGVSLYFFAAAFVFPITSDLALTDIEDDMIGIASSILTMFEMMLSGLILLATAFCSEYVHTFTGLTSFVMSACLLLSSYLLWKTGKAVNNRSSETLDVKTC